ncbi:MAG: shikimate kinase [Chloroflexi bacterium]|nr:shikimate kinase [Chloroflexota bacterium]
MDAFLLYGPPAVGKLTVGRELARLTGYRLFDNHHAYDFVRALFDFGTPEYAALSYEVRVLALRYAARAGVSLVSTAVYSHSAASARLFEETFAVIEGEGGRIRLVQLLCDSAVQRERIQAPERAARHKLTSPEFLEQHRARSDWLTPIPNRESLTLDTTELPPAETARRIAAHYQLG